MIELLDSTSERSRGALETSQAQDFSGRLARQGWVSIPGHLSAQEVALMRREIEANLAAPALQ